MYRSIHTVRFATTICFFANNGLCRSSDVIAQCEHWHWSLCKPVVVTRKIAVTIEQCKRVLKLCLPTEGQVSSIQLFLNLLVTYNYNPYKSVLFCTSDETAAATVRSTGSQVVHLKTCNLRFSWDDIPAPTLPFLVSVPSLCEEP